MIQGFPRGDSKRMVDFMENPTNIHKIARGTPSVGKLQMVKHRGDLDWSSIFFQIFWIFDVFFSEKNREKNHGRIIKFWWLSVARLTSARRGPKSGRGWKMSTTSSPRRWEGPIYQGFRISIYDKMGRYFFLIFYFDDVHNLWFIHNILNGENKD